MVLLVGKSALVARTGGGIRSRPPVAASASAVTEIIVISTREDFYASNEL